MAYEPGKARKADVLAKEESLSDRLAKRRKKIELSVGDEEPQQMADAEELIPNTDDRRGYTKENW